MTNPFKRLAQIKPIIKIRLRVPKVKKLEEGLPPEVISRWQLFLIHLKRWLDKKSKEYAEVGFKVLFQQSSFVLQLIIVTIVGVIIWLLVR